MGDERTTSFTGPSSRRGLHRGQWANKSNAFVALRRLRHGGLERKTGRWHGRAQGRVRAFKVPNVTAKMLLPKLRDSIDQDATLYTDSSKLYTHLTSFS